LSLEPKSTVPALLSAMPPPEPMDRQLNYAPLFCA
jgi:hypothetical protein